MTEGRDEASNENVCMTVQSNGTTHQLDNKIRKEVNADLSNTKPKGEKFIPQIRWPDLMAQIFIHAGCVYGLYLCFYARFYTTLFGKFYSIATNRFAVS